MEPIDVVLIDVPRMLSDIVTNVVAPQPDLRLVERTAGEPVPEADVAVACVDDGELPPRLAELLCGHPCMRVLALSEEGRHAFVYELRPFRNELTDVSPASLLAAIRGNA